MVSINSQMAQELLVGALVKTITDWSNTSSMLLGMEHNGRSFDGKDIDLSKSVGWFTSYYPIQIELDQQDKTEAVLTSVKTQLRKVPKSGMSYGLLRYISNTGSLNQCPPVVFNFLGKNREENHHLFPSITHLSTQETRHKHSKQHYYLEINAGLNETAISIKWRYSRDQYMRETIDRLIEAFRQNLRNLVEASGSSNKPYSVLDFPEADISQDDLDNLLDQL
jgi:non-ribosomal peptide synthase protein (TIGR01720 family)